MIFLLSEDGRRGREIRKVLARSRHIFLVFYLLNSVLHMVSHPVYLFDFEFLWTRASLYVSRMKSGNLYYKVLQSPLFKRKNIIFQDFYIIKKISKIEKKFS